MKRELRCACHGQLLGYEVTPGDDNTGPVTEPPRYADWPYTSWPTHTGGVSDTNQEKQ